jgi:DNA-binding CsgD family transcriptional regulator
MDPTMVARDGRRTGDIAGYAREQSDFQHVWSSLPFPSIDVARAGRLAMQTEQLAPEAPGPAPGSTTLQGRSGEVERIEALLGDCRASRSGALVIRGEAGIGKSALLNEARARAGDMQVLACRGTESETRLPFAALHQLLRPVLGHADAIPATQRRALRCALGLETHDRPEPFLVSVAALSVLAEAAERRPVLCIVDDAHWLDEATADVVLFVARRLDAEPIAMLFAAREEEYACMESLGLPQLPLGGLDADAARAVLDGAGGSLMPEVGDWLIGATQGNPLALLELSAGLTDEQRAGIEPILGPLPISSHIEHAFLERIRRLPSATQELLLVAATDESGDLTTILDAAARLGIGAEALDDAERARLVRVRGLQIELRHPLVRSAIYQAAPLSQRRAVHAALAAVLVGESRADRRAWHRAAASVEPDPTVVDELEQAAARAHARGGFDAASLALERAAALAAVEQRRAGLLTAAAENAWLPGQASRARALLTRARALSAEPAVQADAARLLGMMELTSGMPAESSQILVTAAREVAPDDPERALYLLSLASWGAAFARDADAIVTIAGQAEALALDDNPTTRFLLMRLTGLRAHFTRDYDGAAARFRTVLDILADGETARSLPERLGLVSPVGLFLCDDRAVLALHRRVAAQARDDGLVIVLTQAIPWVALGDIWSGHWPAAAAALAEGLELARGTSQHQIEAHLIAIEALLAAVRGDEERCRSFAADSLQRASERRLVHVTCCATWALAVLELGLGRPEAALTHARALPKTATVDWDALDRIEAAARAGEEDTAREWLEAFEPWARSSEAPWGQAVALHCHALLADDPAEGERMFMAALEMHEHAGRPFERARSELALGELLRRARRRADARTYLRASLERFEALGSMLWAERARAELRATGETARKRDPSTLDQLTAQEVQIAQLVAQGRTNRDVAGQLFLSPRTIDYHLRNVFRKLDITSRTELARIDLAQASGA